MTGGCDIVSGGTDNHLMLVDLRPKRLTGKAAEAALGRAHITCNKNGIPFDPEKPTVTSGIRLGTPAGTTRGFGVAEFQEVGRLIIEVLDGLAANGAGAATPRSKRRCARRVAALTDALPDLPELTRRCAAPIAAADDTQVKDSRPTEDGAAIRRRRVCADCGGRFTTFERVQLRELTVLKRSGRRVPFDRDKLMRSVQVALRKRPVDPERVERMVSGIVRQLESRGEQRDPVASRSASSSWRGCKGLDDVAYVRFASVYPNFREAKDFEELIGELTGEEPAPSAPGRAKPRGRTRERRAPLARAGRGAERDPAADERLHAPRACAGRAPSRPDLAEPFRRRAVVDETARAPRSSRRASRSAAGGRTPSAIALDAAGAGGARRDALRLARALLPPRQDAALRRRDPRGGRRPGGHRARGPGPEGERARAPFPARSGRRGRDRCARRRSAPRPSRTHPAQPRGAGRRCPSKLARTADGFAAGLSGPRLYITGGAELPHAPDPGPRRRDHGGRRDRAGRRSAAHRAPARARGPLAGAGDPRQPPAHLPTVLTSCGAGRESLPGSSSADDAPLDAERRLARRASR